MAAEGPEQAPVKCAALAGTPAVQACGHTALEPSSTWAMPFSHSCEIPSTLIPNLWLDRLDGNCPGLLFYSEIEVESFLTWHSEHERYE